jgi:thiol-disulfide isomerase/thioredoxin
MIRFILLTLLLVNCNYSIAQKSSLLGKILPQKTFATLTGDSIIITTDTTAYILVDYYFAGCKPCNANLPKLEKLKKRFGPKLNIIAINPVDNKENVLAHKLKYKLDHTIIWGTDAEATKTFFGLPHSPFGYPFYLLLNPKGEIIFESINNLTWHKKLAKLIK